MRGVQGDTSRLAALLCLSGFFLHILLFEPLLTTLGINYASMGGAWYEKIHLGTVCILLGFMALLMRRGQPLQALQELWKTQPAALLLLAMDMGLLLYMGLRSGFGGVGFLLDVHIAALLCALILPYAPAAYCRRAMHLFVLLAASNSIIGIGEALTHERLFPFNPEWQGAHEAYFRSSAWLGHPLTNAVFTAIALFTALALPYRVLVKAMLAILFMTAMFAFGGRAGIVLCMVGIAVFCLSSMRLQWRQNPTLLQGIALAAMLWLVPAGAVLGTCALLQGTIGERFAHSLEWDKSAESRLLAPQAFRYMQESEVWLGVSTTRMIDINYRMNQRLGQFALENPWVLMCMYMGVLLFPFWLAATFYFALSLMREKPMALKLAVLAYFAIASTYNSFGCKSPIYLMMVSAVICSARGFALQARRAVPRPVMQWQHA